VKAIQIRETGGPEVIRVEQDVEMPKPEYGQVLIQVAAAGVNYTDVMARQGVYLTREAALELPATLGTEVAGVVAGLGEGVSSPVPGTRVTALVKGGYAEYAVAPHRLVYPLPAQVDFAAAVAYLVQGITAWEILRVSGALAAGERVLVHSGAGGVGTLAIQLAKVFGASTVVATASTTQKRDLAAELGADACVDYTSADWWREVQAATGGCGADVILDAVGGDIGEQSLNCLAPFGRLVVYGVASGRLASYAGSQLMHKNQSIAGYWLTSRLAHDGSSAQVVPQLLELAGQGTIKSVVRHVFPLEEAAEAHRAISGRHTTGKVVLIT
jgi:NADPH2:quinone reductase